MDKLSNIFDRLFMKLDNTGSISNADLMKMVTLSLISDYAFDMIKCNSSYKKTLKDLLNQISNSSCLFKTMDNICEGRGYRNTGEDIFSSCSIDSRGYSCNIDVIECDDIMSIIN